jgi:transcriptional regulator with XRE-family HTH domain
MYGEKIKKMREHYGYSQRELADKMGIPSTTLSFWERSDFPSLEGIIKVCDVFKINLWEFFIDDYSEIKKILPDYITADDSALLSLLNKEVAIETRIQVKKTFLEILKLVLIQHAERISYLPEYRHLFHATIYSEDDEKIVLPLHDDEKQK